MNEKLEKEKSVKSLQEILLKSLKIIFKLLEMDYKVETMSRVKLVLNYII